MYGQVVVRPPNGGAYETEFFSCAGCTVMFRDPGKLTRHERFEPGLPAKRDR